MDNLQEQIMNFNLIYKYYYDNYKFAAKSYGMSVTVAFVLYTVRHFPGCTQSELMERTMMPKTSINSAVKQLEAEGYIVLDQVDADLRKKQMRLTEKGIAFAEDTVDGLYAAECHAFSKLSQKEQELLLSTFGKIVESMKEELGNQG